MSPRLLVALSAIVFCLVSSTVQANGANRAKRQMMMGDPSSCTTNCGPSFAGPSFAAPQMSAPSMQLPPPSQYSVGSGVPQQQPMMGSGFEGLQGFAPHPYAGLGAQSSSSAAAQMPLMNEPPMPMQYKFAGSAGMPFGLSAPSAPAYQMASGAGMQVSQQLPTYLSYQQYPSAVRPQPLMQQPSASAAIQQTSPALPLTTGCSSIAAPSGCACATGYTLCYRLFAMNRCCLSK